MAISPDKPIATHKAHPKPTPPAHKPISVALAGNPNAGKTTIFNCLTGANHQVGNYPGVTVEKKEGRFRHDGRTLNIVDLPGTYSLTAFSLEERVARQFLIENTPDVTVVVLDASNIERNLYLAVQLMEMNIPLVLAFNMSDVAHAKGIEFNLPQLAKLLGAPIVPTVGHKNKGMAELANAVIEVAEGRSPLQPVSIHFGREIDDELDKIQHLLDSRDLGWPGYDTRWIALKLLEHDTDILDRIDDQEVRDLVDRSANHLKALIGDTTEMIIAARRYGFISGACQETVRLTAEVRHTMSDRIDEVMTHPTLGLPLFLGLIYLVFQFTFTLGNPFMSMMEGLFGWLGVTITEFWPKGADSPLQSMLVDGIIGGVGGVIVFLPNIMFLFMAIAILEDSGYMARVAFIMDQLMHRIGLHGKSFIPMIIGFGCSVPAIMATRILENRRDRITTMLVIPLMSCGARLPIYILIIPAFFPRQWQAPVLWSIYLIGVVLAIVLVRVLRGTVFRGESTPFVMELPPYRVPTLRSILIHTWERSWLYLKKAGTIILGISILLWVLTTYPKINAYSEDYDTQAELARATYIDRASRLNPTLGLAEDSPLLTEALRAELQMEETRQAFHPHQPGYSQARQTMDERLEQLAARPQGQALRDFLTMRTAIETIEAEFAKTVADGEIEPASTEYVLLEHKRNQNLDGARHENPQAFLAARLYVDDIRPALTNKLDTITNAKRSEEISYSVAGRIGHAMEPALLPIGFDWKIGTALIGAFAAKEVFVAQMGIVFAVGEVDEQSDALRSQLRAAYTPLTGFCIMLFCLIATPCMVTVVTTQRESGSWKWAMLQLGGLTLIAYILTLAVYQIGSLFGLGA